MRMGMGRWLVLALLTAALVVWLAPHASSDPDGLERVAEDRGFGELAREGFAWSPLPDYEANVPAAERWRVAAAGAIGLAVVTAALWGFGILITRTKDRRA